jgi:hypothetical protein
MNANDTLTAIVETLFPPHGEAAWGADTLDAIVDILREAGLVDHDGPVSR